MDARMNFGLAAAVLVGMAAQVAPVLAQVAGGGQNAVLPSGASLTQLFEIARDVLNVGLIGALGWGITQVIPKLCGWLDQQTALTQELRDWRRDIDKRWSAHESKIDALHEGCIVRQSVIEEIEHKKAKKNEQSPPQQQ